MTIVSDSSPLIALLSIDRINILEQLFGSILIPLTVYDEVFGSPLGCNTLLPDFIVVTNPPSATSVRFLRLNLHAGESEAIALALEKSINKIILDDKQARETAARLGIHVIGTIGLLMLAKEKGYITSIRPLIIQMMNRINFRIAPSVLNRVLTTLKEPII